MNEHLVETLPLITLIGPPNSGKTSLFNALSGKNFKTVNYPGATVEYSVARLHNKHSFQANILDSPGIVSLIPNSPDEKVSIDALYYHPKFGIPDIVIATVDASQLSRHLFLVKQLLESKFRVVVVLTMTDILNKKGLAVSVKSLSDELNCDVVKVDGRTGIGIKDLVEVIDRNIKTSELLGKNKPEAFDSFHDIQKMIDSYKDLEQIEHKVIYELKGNGQAFNLDEVNKKLTVLSAPNMKKGIKAPDVTTLKIDRLLLHRVWGLVFFFLAMSLTFTSIFWLADPLMGFVDDFFGIFSGFAVSTLGNNWLGDLVANGVITGAGSVLVFVPQIIILFLILGLLEDTGYLARGAMLVDKPLSKIGLNGKSFVPMLSGFACAIPAILAARTIPNRRERLLTIFILPLMSCSARLPVYALLIAFLLPSDKLWLGGIILSAIYIFSITSSVLIAGIVNKLKHRIIKEEDSSSFILELPAYRKPVLSTVISQTVLNTKTYLKKAGPIIIIFSLCLWFLTYFPNSSPQIDATNLTEDEIAQAESVERLAGSYAAELGKFLQPVMTPVGMDWKVGVALIASIAAREVFVSSLALIFKVTDDSDSVQESLLNAMRDAEIAGTGQKLFTPATIIGLIVFFVFALQCLSTIAVSRKETGSWKIPMLQMLVFTGLAYFLTFITVNGLRLLGVE